MAISAAPRATPSLENGTRALTHCRSIATATGSMVRSLAVGAMAALIPSPKAGDTRALTKIMPEREAVLGEKLIDLIIRFGFASSRREARYFIQSGAVD